MAGGSRVITQRHFLAGAWAIAASAGLALAQDKAPDRPLEGPKVKDASIPGQKGSLARGGFKAPKEKAGDRPIPPRQFQEALMSLKSDETPAESRLTAAQEQSIQKIRSDFEDSLRAFRQQHEEEFKSLRSQISPEARARLDDRLRGQGLARPDRPLDGVKKAKAKDAVDHPADEAMDPAKKPADAESQAAVQKLQELLESAPKMNDAQTKVWGVLSEKQQALVKTRLDELRKQDEKNRADGKRPAAAAPGADALKNFNPEQRQKVREKLQGMSPEERRQFIEQLREKRQSRRPGSGSDKPPPPMDDVNVPKTDPSSPPPRKDD